MTFKSETFITQNGDIALLIDPRGNKHIVQLVENSNYQTNHGQIYFNDLIGLPWGSRVKSHLGKNFF